MLGSISVILQTDTKGMSIQLEENLSYAVHHNQDKANNVLLDLSLKENPAYLTTDMRSNEDTNLVYDEVKCQNDKNIIISNDSIDLKENLFHGTHCSKDKIEGQSLKLEQNPSYISNSRMDIMTTHLDMRELNTRNDYI